LPYQSGATCQLGSPMWCPFATFKSLPGSSESDVASNLPRQRIGRLLTWHNQRMKQTGAAILVSRGMKIVQAAPAA
jgi:hypothetical protein